MPERMSEEQLVAIEERIAAATEGPWSLSEDGDGVRLIVGPDGEVIAHEPSEVRGYSSCTIVTPAGTDGNLHLLRKARTDLPACVREIRLLREENERLRASLRDANENRRGLNEYRPPPGDAPTEYHNY